MKTKIIKWGKLVLILAFFVYCIVLTYQNRVLRQNAQLLEVQLKAQTDSTVLFRTKNNEITAKWVSVQVENNNARKALETANFTIAELKDREVKWRKTIFALEMRIVTYGSGVITLHDSIPVPGQTIIQPIKTGKWNDNYLFLSPVLKGSELSFDYIYQTGLKLTQEKQGKNIVVSGWLVNPVNPDIPNITGKIVTANSITIVPNKHWWNHWYIYLGAGLVGGTLLFK